MNHLLTRIRRPAGETGAGEDDWEIIFWSINPRHAMAFRRNRDLKLVWKKWVDRNRDELIATGVPAEIYSEELRWLRFLEEDGLDWESGWQVKMLSTQQAERLHRFLFDKIQQDELNNFKGCLKLLMDVMS